MMVLIGGAMYGTMSSFVKLSYSWGYHAAELAFFQALLAAIFLGLSLLFSSAKNKEKINGNSLGKLLLTGGTIGITNYLYYQSVSFISASLAIVILMQFTWLCLLIEWLIFKKRPGNAEMLTVIFVLIGTVLAGNLLQAGTIAFSWKGLALVLGSSVSYAVYIVANSRAGSNVGWLPKSALIMTGSATAIFLVNVDTIVASVHFSYQFAFVCVFLAVAGTAIPTALFAAAIPKVGAGLSSILMTIELPVAIICAGFVLNEHVSIVQVLGILIMLVAISAMNYYKTSKTEKQIN